MLANGEDVASVCRALEISESAFNSWRSQHCGKKADDTKRHKELEKENSKLKRLLADAESEKSALRGLSRGK